MSIICIICHNQVCKHLEHSCARITDTTHTHTHTHTHTQRHTQRHTQTASVLPDLGPPWQSEEGSRGEACGQACEGTGPRNPHQWHESRTGGCRTPCGDRRTATEGEVPQTAPQAQTTSATS